VLEGAALQGICSRLMSPRSARIRADDRRLLPTRALLARSARTRIPALRPTGPFRSTLCRVEVHDSARKHGVADEDVIHAVDHALVIEDAGEDPDRWLVIGPDRAGNFLEVVVMTTAESSQLAIHAMPMRARFRRLLEP